jgi:hypothetical protein
MGKNILKSARGKIVLQRSEKIADRISIEILHLGILPGPNKKGLGAQGGFTGEFSGKTR